MKKRITDAAAGTDHIKLGGTLKNGCIESFNIRFRDALLDGEIYCSSKEAQIIIV